MVAVGPVVAVARVVAGPAAVVVRVAAAVAGPAVAAAVVAVAHVRPASNRLARRAVLP